MIAEVAGYLEKVAVPIITYHSIDSSGSVISTRPSLFRQQMEILKNSGYRAVTLRELVEEQWRPERQSKKTVVLTFDDGFKNFYTEAAPILVENGFRATVFLVTDHCGGHNDWSGNPADLPRSELLSWGEIKNLDELGFEFGCHTRRHRDLSKLKLEEAVSEIRGSKDAVSDRLGREAATFAYPYGRSNRVSRRIAGENFVASCSTDLGKVSGRSDMSALCRIDSYYLANSRILEMLDTLPFDGYMRFRQILRDAKAFYLERKAA